MLSKSAAVVLLSMLAACNGEQATNPDGDADTDTDTDSDTDSDTDTDTEPTSDNNTIDKATDLPIVEDDLTAIDDRIEKAGDRDFFKIDVVKDEAYWVYVAGGGEAGEPDCVVRVYNDKKEMVYELDDLPYRLYGTDPGAIFRATDDGTYYIEVLEWGDWAGETPAGGSSWDYTLYVAPTSVLYPTGGLWEIHPTLNDTIADERDSLEAESYSWYSDPWSADNNLYMTLGEIDKAGDVDHFGLGIEGTDPGFLEFSIFQGIDTSLDAVLEIVDDAGKVVASSQGEGAYYHAPDNDWYQGKTVGVAFPYFSAGNLYVRVADKAGGFGKDHWYAVIGTVYGWNTDVVAFHEEPSGVPDLPGTADAEAILTDNTIGGQYGFVVGKFGENGDDVDTIHVDADAVAGQFLTVMVATSTNGSFVDARVHVFDKNLKEIDSAEAHPTLGEGDDPSLLDIELETGGDYWIQIDNVNKVYGDSGFYQVYFTTSDDPLEWKP